MGIDIDESGNPRVAGVASSNGAAPPPSRRRILLIISICAIVCVVLLVAIALVTNRDTSSKKSTLTSSYPSSSQSPQKKLSSLPVKGRAPKTDYDRALFGSPWSDDVTVEGGHNGCDTRNDILRRDLSGAGYQLGNSCIVLSGVLNDPYTGEAVLYQHEPEELSPIQIDHIVPLLDAWQKGAQGWDELTRRNFANDPINLQATTAAVNQEKGSGDAATWLPDNKSYRCTYAARIVDVKTRYGLWITADEHEALAFLLNDCKADGATSAPPPVLTSRSATPSHSAPPAHRPSPPPPRAPRPAPAPAPTCYRNVDGDCITRPGDSPAGANALCRDGTYSFSSHRPGSCARHGGVAEWLD
ncbi:MAG: DUF1524 domain-containing protein [Mycobacterium sp.]